MINRIEITYFDVFFRICNNRLHNFLTENHRKKIAAAIYADGEFSDIEMYEIMMMPVIQLNPIDEKSTSIIWLRFICLSQIDGCKFLNLFSGKNWQFYIVKF
jgi:hypothetical protein